MPKDMLRDAGVRVMSSNSVDLSNLTLTNPDFAPDMGTDLPSTLPQAVFPRAHSTPSFIPATDSFLNPKQPLRLLMQRADDSRHLLEAAITTTVDRARSSYLTEPLYRYYLVYSFGEGNSPSNPVEMPDDGELQTAVMPFTDRWYKQFASAHGPGFYPVDENAASKAPWYTGKSDYSGLGLLAHSGDVRVTGTAAVTIQRIAEGYQKTVDFRVTWSWNDEIHGMTRQEWERRYPGQSGWKSPEVWLHWLLDWYGAYYVRVHWFDGRTYKGAIYGGNGAYENAVNGDATESSVNKSPVPAGLEDHRGTFHVRASCND